MTAAKPIHKPRYRMSAPIRFICRGACKVRANGRLHAPLRVESAGQSRYRAAGKEALVGNRKSVGRSEVFIPLGPGATVRARYAGPGGGALNIYCGDDIVLHVNPRPGEGLVLNSHFGDWGPEERPRGFPFPEGADVALTVRVQPNGFLITAVCEGSEPFTCRYAFRHPKGAELDRATIDIPGLHSLSVQAGK
jgi:hypothetical protein